jgi:hypothetical protein
MLGHQADRDDLNGIGGLLKEEWRFPRWIGASLDRMSSVVSTDAVNAANGKDFLQTNNGDCHLGDGKNRRPADFRFGVPGNGDGGSTTGKNISAIEFSHVCFPLLLNCAGIVIDSSRAADDYTGTGILLRPARLEQ